MTGRTDRDSRSVINRFKERVFNYLDAREFYVITLRLGVMGETKQSLQEIGVQLNLSRERIRQIEASAFKKISRLDALPVTLRENASLEELMQLIGRTVRDLGGVATVAQVSVRLACVDRELSFCSLILEKLQALNLPEEDGRQLPAMTWQLDPRKNLFTDQQQNLLNELATELLPRNVIMRADHFVSRVKSGFAQFDVSNLETLIDHGFILELTCDPENIARNHRYLYKTLSKPSREIGRAIIAGSTEYYPSQDVEQGIHLIKGLRCDQITGWLDNHSDYSTGSRALNALCRRQKDIFAETAIETWGLRVAGAEEGVFGEERQPVKGLIVAAIKELVEGNQWRIANFKISKDEISNYLADHYSGGWIGQNIDSMLEDGYLKNISPSTGRRIRYNLRPNLALPFSERVSSITAPSGQIQHGTVIRLVIEALTESPNGLDMEKVIRYCKKQNPLIKADTISIYLRTHLSDLVEKSSESIFTLRPQPSFDSERPEDQLKTIQIIVVVMATAEEPLPNDVIYHRCRELGPVRRNAVMSYLSQNYGNLFRKTADDMYQLRRIMARAQGD